MRTVLKPAFLTSLIMFSVVATLPNAVSILLGVRELSQVFVESRALPRFQPRPISSTSSTAVFPAAEAVVMPADSAVVIDRPMAAAVMVLSSFFINFMLSYSFIFCAPHPVRLMRLPQHHLIHLILSPFVQAVKRFSPITGAVLVQTVKMHKSCFAELYRMFIPPREKTPRKPEQRLSG